MFFAPGAIFRGNVVCVNRPMSSVISISAVSILRGYGFVQFMHEADAREAVRMENGGLLKGNKLGITFLIF